MSTWLNWEMSRALISKAQVWLCWGHGFRDNWHLKGKTEKGGPDANGTEGIKVEQGGATLAGLCPLPLCFRPHELSRLALCILLPWYFTSPQAWKQWSQLTADWSLWNAKLTQIFPTLCCYSQVFYHRDRKLINISFEPQARSYIVGCMK